MASQLFSVKIMENMGISNDSEKIQQALSRGVENVIDGQHLKSRMENKEKLRIKLGIDPTGPKIHIGRATQLLKLKEFQDLGHQIVFIIGDFTAQIGDASDKKAMRRALTKEEVRKNMKDYLSQVGKILDIRKVEVHKNSEWLSKLSAKDLMSLSMSFTAQQMIQRRNFKERWEEGIPIGLHELHYPLFQGYDSVAIKADVEIGGFDQLFNLKIGREMQKMSDQQPQDIMALKMLSGTDGRKMSTSWGNVINITDKAEDMFGKLMSMKDELILNYFELCTRIPQKELEEIKASLEEKKINPKDLKERLAEEIVGIYHGKKMAKDAKQEFERVFKEKKNPNVIPEERVSEKEINILDLLVKTKLTLSKTEAKRLVLQKAVEIDGKVKSDWKETVSPEKGMVLKAGKRRFVKIS